tara:strand:- start:1900 stop:2916 length:1017 start_codon:yes stop_codon:yes gene_type:complete
MEINKDKVLITGASGYIALHCISELLKNDYIVKGSLRDLKREVEVRKSLNLDLDDNRLEFCYLDLLRDEGWEDATSDCDYLLHVASPFVIEEPKNESILINPALEGTLRALKAAENSNIKKVVITSSMASIAYGRNKRICDPNDWTDINQNVGAYIKSKTIAEKAAWDFIENQKNDLFKLTTIHPGMVFGPLLNKDVEGASASLINNMITGKFPAIPQIYFTVVDVRDVAKLHVQSLKNSRSDNKRIIATSQSSFAFAEISKILRDLGFDKSPKNLIPNQVINSLAPFKKEMRSTAFMIQRGSYETDISETISIYDWNPIPLQKTLEDMLASLERISN